MYTSLLKPTGVSYYIIDHRNTGYCLLQVFSVLIATSRNLTPTDRALTMYYIG